MYMPPPPRQKRSFARQRKGGEPPNCGSSPAPVLQAGGCPMEVSVPGDGATSLAWALLPNVPPPFPRWDRLPGQQTPLAPVGPRLVHQSLSHHHRTTMWRLWFALAARAHVYASSEHRLKQSLALQTPSNAKPGSGLQAAFLSYSNWVLRTLKGKKNMEQ